MANWITPVTYWEEIPYFNTDDYNRIVGNLLYLKDLSEKLFARFDYLHMEEQKSFVSLMFAKEFNAIEENLKKLNDNTYKLDIGTSKEYFTNQKYPNYEDYNRIEKAESLLFNYLWGQITILDHLPIVLGGEKSFGRRVKYAYEPIESYRFNFRLGANKGGIF